MIFEDREKFCVAKKYHVCGQEWLRDEVVHENSNKHKKHKGAI